MQQPNGPGPDSDVASQVARNRTAFSTQDFPRSMQSLAVNGGGRRMGGSEAGAADPIAIRARDERESHRRESADCKG